MSKTYIRVIDSTDKRIIGFTERASSSYDLSFKEANLLSAELFTRTDCKIRYNEKIYYPVYVQVVVKNKYKNGNCTKKVIFEKRIE